MKLTNARNRLVLVLVAIAALLFHSGSFAIGPAYSGSWYNPEQDGHGFSLEYSILDDGTPLVLAYWYVYDADGNPIFLVGQGEPGDGNTVVLEFVAPHGMKFGDFDAGDVVREDGGSGSFTFDNSENGVFDYEPSNWMVQTYGVSPISTPVVKLVGVTLKEPSSFDSYVETYSGSWTGRMTYDRRSLGACDDAEVHLSVQHRYDRGENAWQLYSINVIRDGGGQAIYTWTFGDALFGSFIASDFRIFGEVLDMNIQFPPRGKRGHAEGYWNYRSGTCYGEWTFTKD
jgi:hypothetical protein